MIQRTITNSRLLETKKITNNIEIEENDRKESNKNNTFSGDIS